MDQVISYTVEYNSMESAESLRVKIILYILMHFGSMNIIIIDNNNIQLMFVQYPSNNILTLINI